MPDFVPVEVGACRCPGAPHPDGDIVFLHPKLSLRGGLIAEREMVNLSMRQQQPNPSPGGSTATLELEGLLLETYVRFGVADWTFVDDSGEPVPVTEAEINERLLSDFAYARPIGEKGDELYTQAILDPLVARLSKSSRSSQPRASTSRSTSTSSTTRRPKLLKPSSTSTTQTDSTATTS